MQWLKIVRHERIHVVLHVVTHHHLARCQPSAAGATPPTTLVRKRAHMLAPMKKCGGMRQACMRQALGRQACVDYVQTCVRHALGRRQAYRHIRYVWEIHTREAARLHARTHEHMKAHTNARTPKHTHARTRMRHSPRRTTRLVACVARRSPVIIPNMLL